MKALLSSVVWRYFAISIQFAVLILIARSTDINIAGKYFALFGFVTVSSVAVGLGIPDGIVRHLPAYRRSVGINKIKSIVLRNILSSIGISAIMVVASCFIAAPFADFDSEVLLLAGLWWLAYALTFLFAQTLVALERPASGAFVAYSSISIGYALTLIPFTLVTHSIKLTGLLYAANAGAWSAALAGCVLVVRQTSNISSAGGLYRSGSDLEMHSLKSASNPSLVDELPIFALLSTGFPIMLGRFMQASLPWIPVWTLIAVVSAHEAAIYSAASRLTVAVTSVVAALRFSVRPAIVDLNVSERYVDIAKLNRKCSLISAFPPVIGIAVLLLGGNMLIPAALGHGYAGATAILLILMFGVLAEAFGGMSDEILKMTGRTHIFLFTLVLAVVFQVSACQYLAPQGAHAVAFATVIAFAIQYVGQVFWLSLRTPIKILPLR